MPHFVVAVRQLVSKVITTEGQVIDGFTASGLPKDDDCLNPPRMRRAQNEIMVKRILKMARLPARLAGRGHQDRAGAGGAVLCSVGRLKTIE